LVSFDTEAIGYDTDRHPVGNGLVFTAQFAWYDAEGVMQVRLLHNYGKSEGLIYDLTRFFQSSDVAKIAHNAPFDFHMVGNHGIVIEGLLLDTMNMDQNLDENRAASLASYRIPGVGNGHGLKECAKDHLGRERLDYGHTFGSARLRADGLPYASGQLEVPSLNEYLFTEQISSYTGEPLYEPPTYQAAAAVALHEEADWEQAEAYSGTNRPYENPHLGPFSRWARFYDYACADVVDGLELLYLFRSRMEKIPFSQGKSYWDYYLEVEAPTTRLICDMEKRGMYFDTDTAREMLEVAEQDLARLETEAVKWCGFPLRTKKKISNLRLAAFLHGDPSNPLPIFRGSSKKKVDFYIHGLGLPVMRSTETGKAGTGAEDLKALRRWAKLTDHRGDLSGLDALIDLSKREWHYGNIQSQVEKTDRWNRIRCRINQVGTTSGRFSTSDPLNLQNVTTGEKDLYHDRDCFAAPPGKVLIVMDFSQLEYRLLAHFSQEPKLIALFHEGWDLHSLTCYNIFPEVRSATVEIPSKPL
jgi:DNA polymerase-1